jgi:catechol 2,3-dioxygenase-like lactoylglutathione lyase family enzyme
MAGPAASVASLTNARTRSVVFPADGPSGQRSGEAPFPSVRVTPETVIDLVSRSRGESNVDHICLTVQPLDWNDVIRSRAFDVLEGPVSRFGARGTATSVYVRDPDGNTVELRWYPQDAAVAADSTASAE